MKLIFADKDIPKLWERIGGKAWNDLSLYEIICIKSNTDKFVKQGFIVLTVNVKKSLWEQTSHLADGNNGKSFIPF